MILHYNTFLAILLCIEQFEFWEVEMQRKTTNTSWFFIILVVSRYDSVRQGTDYCADNFAKRTIGIKWLIGLKSTGCACVMELQLVIK